MVEINYRDQHFFFFAPGCKHAYFCFKTELAILTWESMGTDWLLETTSRSKSKKCNFWYFIIGFISRPCMLLFAEFTVARSKSLNMSLWFIKQPYKCF